MGFKVFAQGPLQQVRQLMYRFHGPQHAPQMKQIVEFFHGAMGRRIELVFVPVAHVGGETGRHGDGRGIGADFPRTFRLRFTVEPDFGVPPGEGRIVDPYVAAVATTNNQGTGTERPA